MKLQNNNAVVLQLLRLGSAAIVVLLINLGFYLYGKETPVWILFGLGLLTIIVGLINILFILMLLLILFDILTYFQVKKYFKR